MQQKGTQQKGMWRQYQWRYLMKDIPAGIIIALVSIPISMGYAQVAGLPAVYGLYGSLLPILCFGLFSSSPQIIFGVDAAPAALVCGMLATLGITAGSVQAQRIIPVITLATSMWLFLFYLIRADRFVNYISTPVMGGFVSGISSTIILMQAPKLFGGVPGTGEMIELLAHLIQEIVEHFHLLSFLIGLSTIIVIQIIRKVCPKLPISVILMGIGAYVSWKFPVKEYGVQLLPAVRAGLPQLSLPELHILSDYLQTILISSFTIALVIVAETLLATNNYAMKGDYEIRNNREILAYAVGNLFSALTGCLPVNGSISRTGIGAQFGAKTQVTSFVASITMAGVLLYGTGFIGYLPVPVLTGIVVSALISIMEWKLAGELWKVDRTEFIIFMAAYLGVLFLGTVYGVLIGVILSFVTVIIRAITPPRAYLGCVEGHDGFFNMQRIHNARAIEKVVIYRFTGELFFANMKTFQEDIEKAASAPGIRIVIVDASAIGSIDVTAAQRLMMLHRHLVKNGIRFYMAEHDGHINDQLMVFGAGELLREGAVKSHIAQALEDAGIKKPYPLVKMPQDTVENESQDAVQSYAGYL